jgi:hypothetical protein
VRSTLVGCWVVGLLAGAAAPARAQFSYDARRIGMGGLSLSRDGNLRRYNAAYRAVPNRHGDHAKLTIPIPLGLIQALKDSAAFDFDSSYFNPLELANLILNPPLFLEVRKAPTATNDVTFTIGRNALVIDLGAARQLVPTDAIGLGGSSRFLDLGLTIKGVHAGVMAFLQEDIGFTLGDTLRNFLRNADSARVRTRYLANVDGTAQVGLAPTLSYAGRLAGGAPDSDDGFYIGGALHYYMGVGFASAAGTAGIRTGDTLFAGSNPVTPSVDALVRVSNRVGKQFGHGVGGDIGFAYVSGAFEFGVGVNDIGATITWKDTQVRRVLYDTASNDIKDSITQNHVETKTKLPLSYIANVTYRMGQGLTLGGDIVDNGRGTIVHVGAELRFGPLALRGGVARDTRKKVQLGAGTGLRFGPFSLDVGFWTHSNSLSNARGITMATSFSIY